jgi:hypothetical protein
MMMLKYLTDCAYSQRGGNMRILFTIAIILLSGCIVPAGGFDCDESGICVWPEPGAEILEGDTIVIRNGSDGDVTCNSSWQIYDPSTFSVDVADGDVGQIELSEPRDVYSLEPGSPWRGVVAFYCWSPGEPVVGELRRWEYQSPI